MPVPGGPQMIADSGPAAPAEPSISRRSGLPGRSTSPCPRTSSSDRGRIRAASGGRVDDPRSAAGRRAPAPGCREQVVVVAGSHGWQAIPRETTHGEAPRPHPGPDAPPRRVRRAPRPVGPRRLAGRGGARVRHRGGRGHRRVPVRPAVLRRPQRARGVEHRPGPAVRRARGPGPRCSCRWPAPASATRPSADAARTLQQRVSATPDVASVRSPFLVPGGPTSPAAAPLVRSATASSGPGFLVTATLDAGLDKAAQLAAIDRIQRAGLLGPGDGARRDRTRQRSSLAGQRHQPPGGDGPARR